MPSQDQTPSKPEISDTPRIAIVHGNSKPTSGMLAALSGALGGKPVTFLDKPALALVSPVINSTPAADFIETGPGSTVFNGQPSPIVCVEIDLTTGQTVRVTPQPTIEALRAFAATARALAPSNHLVLEHPPAVDTLTQELADQQTAFARSRSNVHKVNPSDPPAFI